MDALLRKYKVDMHRGFLPSEDPLQNLSEPYEAWNQLANNFTAYINAGTIRKEIERLETLDTTALQTDGELERAMLILSFSAHAYVHFPPDSTSYIPESIAVPWVQVAQRLKRNPVVSHASIVLHNWRRLDQSKEVTLDNLATSLQFHGGLDESWFYLVTVAIEQVGAEAIPMIVGAMSHVEKGDLDPAAASLQTALPILAKLSSTLRRMYEQCDPHIFYKRIRPFLASFNNVEYRGTDLGKQSFHGGSAAQSSLLQFFDAAFGIAYENESANHYLRLMRKHMPFAHAQFLTYIEKTSQLKSKCNGSKELEALYKECVSALLEFRNEHLKMVALYIMKQAKNQNKTAVGTGGTSPLIFLKSVRDQNKELL